MWGKWIINFDVQSRTSLITTFGPYSNDSGVGYGSYEFNQAATLESEEATGEGWNIILGDYIEINQLFQTEGWH